MGCADVESDKSVNIEDITASVDGGASWSLGSIPLSLQTQEAALLCKEQGGELQVIDTRTTAPTNPGSLTSGDIQFICFGGRR